MSGLMKGFGKVASMIGLGRAQAGLPPLPPGLGLPEKSRSVGRAKGEEWGGVGYDKQLAKANTYNKAFADLLNNQPQLSGGERREIYNAYSDKFIPISYQKVAPGTKSNKKAGVYGDNFLYDYGMQLSSAPAKKGNQAAQVPAPQAPAAALPTPPTGTLGAGGTVAPKPPAQTQAPATVGPVPQPQTQAPAPAQAPAAAAAAAAGNVVGSVGTMGADASSKGRARRGRMATLLTGLGGDVERFG